MNSLGSIIIVPGLGKRTDILWAQGGLSEAGKGIQSNYITVSVYLTFKIPSNDYARDTSQRVL